jgi:hypothetical protein
MEKTILRSDVVKALASGEHFDMEFITCNRRKGTGGKLISVESWLKISASTPEETLPFESIRTSTTISKDPHHDIHGTVNIFNPENAGVHPVSVHYDLIQFFNGKRVIN